MQAQVVFLSEDGKTVLAKVKVPRNGVSRGGTYDKYARGKYGDKYLISIYRKKGSD